MAILRQSEQHFSTYDDEKMRKMEGVTEIVLRPFTPWYSCIISPWLPEAHVEPLFRQLCALHWLLEALTIDHSHHTMKPQTKKFKIPMLRTTGRKPSRRGSILSLSRTSGGSSPQSSMISMNPGSDEPQSVVTQGTGSKDIEDNESCSTKPDEEPLHVTLHSLASKAPPDSVPFMFLSDLQKLLEMVREDARRTIIVENGTQKKVPSILSMMKQNKSESASKDMQTTYKSSDKTSSTSGESHIQPIQKKASQSRKSRPIRDILHCKSGICSTMRAKFYSVAQEAGFCLQDKMEILMKYFDLLSKLPEDLKNFRPAKKVLAKLQKFGENLDLRIRPHVLLKVLQDLRVWELCSPDIAVAIEFVREHIIHMPQEDYVNWLQSRINIPIRPRSAPA
nr:coiled-coil domain-containing protein 60 [Loxodonta africana]